MNRMKSLKKSLHIKDPYSTAAGKCVDQITTVSDLQDPTTLDVVDPNVMQLCHLISATDSGSKDAVKAIRNRMLQAAARSHPQLLRTLILLDLLVSNCGDRIHIEVATEKFLDDLKAILSPKYAIPESCRQRIYDLVGTWCTAFRGRPELSAVGQFYDTIMLSSSVRHEAEAGSERRRSRSGHSSRSPPTTTYSPPEYDRVVPHGYAHAPPPMIVPLAMPPQYPVAGAYGASTVAAVASARPPPPTEYRITAESIRKIEADLETITNNVMVFHEIMNASDVAQLPDYLDAVGGGEFGLPDAADLDEFAAANPPDWETAQALVSQCRAMQSRLHELIDWVNSPAAAASGSQLPDSLLARILEVNDDLSTMFERANNYQVESRANQQRARATSPSNATTTTRAAGTGQRLAERQSFVSANPTVAIPAATPRNLHQDLLDLSDPVRSVENEYVDPPPRPVVQASPFTPAPVSVPVPAPAPAQRPVSTNPNPAYGDLASVFAATPNNSFAPVPAPAPAPAANMYPSLTNSSHPPSGATSFSSTNPFGSNANSLQTLGPRYGPLPPVPSASAAPSGAPPAGWMRFDEPQEQRASQLAPLSGFEQLSLSHTSQTTAPAAPSAAAPPPPVAQPSPSNDNLISF